MNKIEYTQVSRHTACPLRLRVPFATKDLSRNLWTLKPPSRCTLAYFGKDSVHPNLTLPDCAGSTIEQPHLPSAHAFTPWSTEPTPTHGKVVSVAYKVWSDQGLVLNVYSSSQVNMPCGVLNTGPTS